MAPEVRQAHPEAMVAGEALAAVSDSPGEADHLPIAEAVASSTASALVALVALVDPSLATTAGPALAAIPSWTPVLAAAWRRRRANVDLAVEAGAGALGVSIDELAAASVGDPFKEQLSFSVIEAAARSAYTPKIRALGRAWAAGVFTVDEGKLAQEVQFVRTMERIELPHIRLLEFTGKPGEWSPRTVNPSGLSGQHLLTADEVFPEYGEMIGQLRGVLVSEGLIELQPAGSVTYEGKAPSSPAFYRITEPGRAVLRRLKEAAEAD